MKDKTEIRKPIKVKRGKHLAYGLMTVAWLQFGFDVLDYLCVHNTFPSVK